MKEKFINKGFSESSLKTLVLVDDVLGEYALQGYDLSLRQLYYQLVARDFIENSQRSYKRLGKLITNARLAGLVDWRMIVDRSRSAIANPHWDNPGQIIKDATRSFQTDKWDNQPIHIEVMVEKDALSGVLEPICSYEDIIFTANKGYPSASILYRMGLRLQDQIEEGKFIYILHLGDHDPSGIDMTRDLVDRLELFTGINIEIVRLALNMDQVNEYNPPKNPAKVTDSRYQAYLIEFGSSSWELDALEPNVLANLIKDFISNHKDLDLWAEAVEKETEMQKELQDFAGKYK